MSRKKIEPKNFIDIKKIRSFIPKNLKLKKILVSPSKVIEETKTKLNKYYENLKKEKKKKEKNLKSKRN